MDDEHYMRAALAEAEKGLITGDWPIGCVVVLDDKIIARGHATAKSTKNKLAHAEMNTLNQIQHILKDRQGEATLYTTYEPCPMCFGAIVLSRIKRVVAGIDIDSSGAMHFRENLPKLFKQEKFKVEFTPGVLADECYEVFIKGEPTQQLVKTGWIKPRRE